MKTFLEETLDSITKKHKDLSSIKFVFPSKRAGNFFKYYLKKNTQHTFFSPAIISIEEFIEDVSGLEIMEPISLLFKSYEAYLQTTSITEKDTFEQYHSWISTLLSDFNEVDRYLIPPKQFFSYLHSIQDINHWYLQNEKSALIKNYIKFWESLYDFYTQLNKLLFSKSLGYQGMVYRQAAEMIDDYILKKGDKTHIFIGFNALNTAEQQIIKKLINTGSTDIYWDVDQHFFKNKMHSASYFSRKYFNDWEYYKSNSLKGIANNFELEKNIQCVECHKNIDQVKYVGQLLSQSKKEKLDHTAIILADESLLIPLLHSLPLHIKEVNITMGLSIKRIPSVLFFEELINLHTKPSNSYYYKDVLSILNNPLLYQILPNAKDIVSQIINQNHTYLNFSEILGLASLNKEVISFLFKPLNNQSNFLIKTCLSVLFLLQEKKNTSTLNQIVIHKLIGVFQDIETENEKFKYIQSISTLQYFFSEHLNYTTIDYKGDAYQGLQIMGILETRVLDFKNIIITSVNEGNLPSGKTNNSYITYDLKQQFGLPNFIEKDAIYTYHFYRLLHRSSNITLLYNTLTEGLQTSEKSRFISQLKINTLPNHHLVTTTVTPRLTIKTPELINIPKSEELMQQLKNLANKGFSPSSLTSYIRNPIDFYFQKVLQIKEFEEVEETIAANTLGTIVHDTLEIFYKPFEGHFLNIENLVLLKNTTKKEVSNQFTKTFKGDFLQGKNRIIFEAAIKYINNFIDFEIAELKAGNTIKILKIESKLETLLEIPSLPFPVKLKGIIDRLDTYNGTLRVIDYKTGKVEQGELELVEWNYLTQDYKYSKIFQVLCYVTMLSPETKSLNLEAGIISFKNLKKGFLKFATKPSSRSNDKNTIINKETLKTFSTELEKLILEICNPDFNFIEKEV